MPVQYDLELVAQCKSSLRRVGKGFAIVVVTDDRQVAKFQIRPVLHWGHRRRQLDVRTLQSWSGDFNGFAQLRGKPGPRFGIVKGDNKAIVNGGRSRRKRQTVIVGDRLAFAPVYSWQGPATRLSISLDNDLIAGIQQLHSYFEAPGRES